MSIGQKFELVADAVYEKGKTDIISNSKYIEKQATGKVIHLDDVSEVPHKVKIKAGAKSKQLLPYPYHNTSKTLAGITYTDNGDGSVTVNGTATDYSMFYLAKEYPFKAGETYTFGEEFLGVDMYVRFTDENGATKYATKTITWKEDYKLQFIYLQVNPNNTVSGTVYPYLVEGDTYDGIWEPYIPPATEPIEVKVYGENLCDGILELGGISEKTGANISISTSMRTVNYIPVLPNTTYTISREDTTKNIKTRVYDKDKNYIGYVFAPTTSPSTITTKDNYAFMRLELIGVNLEEKIQFEYGSYETEYESCVGQTIIATPEGTEVSSLCPNMTIIADNDVTVDYYSSYGMQTEYDRFWDEYQRYNNRYIHAFAGGGWTMATFKPKKDIIVSGAASHMFTYSRITDLISALANVGRKLDTSRATTFPSMFNSTYIERIPTIDCTGATTIMSATFYSSNIKYIQKVVSADTTQWHSNAFQNATSLVHCIFEGVIAYSINMQWSTLLDLESVISLFKCLKTFASDDANHMTQTITLSAATWALTQTDEFKAEFDGLTGEEVCEQKGWIKA